MHCKIEHQLGYWNAISVTHWRINQLDITRQCSDAGLIQIVQTVTRGRHTLDLFLTNCKDTVSCTVAKSCLNNDHFALMVNCDTYCSVSTDCNQTN